VDPMDPGVRRASVENLNSLDLAVDLTDLKDLDLAVDLTVLKFLDLVDLMDQKDLDLVDHLDLVVRRDSDPAAAPAQARIQDSRNSMDPVVDSSNQVDHSDLVVHPTEADPAYLVDPQTMVQAATMDFITLDPTATTDPVDRMAPAS